MRKAILAVLTVLAGVAAHDRASADPKLPGVVFYDKVKAFENKTVWPTPNASYTVATFDPSNGAYTDFTPNLPKGPIVYPSLASAGVRMPYEVNAVDVTFHIQLLPVPPDPGIQLSLDGKPPPPAPPPWPGREEDVTFKCNGHIYHVHKTDKEAVCTVGRTDTFVNWEISSGKHHASGNWRFTRPNIIGAGDMIVSAVPMLVIYAPPNDSRSMNYADYTDVSTMGSTASLSWGQSDSTKKPADQQPYASVATGKQVMDLAGKAAKEALGQAAGKDPKTGKDNPNDAGNFVAAAFSAIASGFGSASETTEIGKSSQGSHSIALTTTNTTTFKTNTHAGPGRSDVIVFLRNARFVWMGVPDVHVALISYDGTALVTADLLRSEREEIISKHLTVSPGLHLDQATIESMLRLDPFVNPRTFGVNLHPTLDPHRFVPGQERSVVATDGDELTWQAETTVSNQQSLAHSSIHTEDYSAGFLSFLGIGVSETKDTRTMITNGSSTAITTLHGTKVHAKFFAAPNEVYRIKPYYDRVFGTFAYVPMSH